LPPVSTTQGELVANNWNNIRLQTPESDSGAGGKLIHEKN
jgi:hypothetical protein